MGPARHVGCSGGYQHDGVHTGIWTRGEIRVAWREIGSETLLRWYVLHVLFFPFIIVIFMAIHFWRVRKDGGISGPL